MAEQKQRISGDKLRAFIASAFEAVEVPRGDARVIARTDDAGRHQRLRRSRRVPSAAIHPPHQGRRGQRQAGYPRRARGCRAWRWCNGDNGMGHLVMKFRGRNGDREGEDRGRGLGRRALEQSRRSGLAVRSMPLEHDMIGLYMAVGSANHLPPWGGLDMLLSTNPIAVAVPTGEEPAIVLDMATTVAAYGKVKTKAQRGEMMPEGWMMDRAGQSADRSEARERRLPAADRRLQGLRPRADHRHARGQPERRGDGQGRGRFQQRRHHARPTPATRSSPSTSKPSSRWRSSSRAWTR